MNVTFSYIGLSFEAEVDYEPHVPARLYGPPENCSPAEGGYAEITDLKCVERSSMGTVIRHDARFLLDSDLVDDLNAAAYEACVIAEKRARDEARADREYERRRLG